MSQPTVAILGASQKRAKFGNKSLRAHHQAGYQVFPINPRETTIEGLPCYARLEDLPTDTLQRISVYLDPVRLLPLLPDISNFPGAEIWLNPGTSSPEIVAELQTQGLRVIEGCSILDLGVTPADFPDE